MEPSQQSNSIILPLAIIVGFAMIALAIFFTAERRAQDSQTATSTPNTDTLTGVPRKVDETDYIRGNPNAPILIIEYSDYDCPFCKQYHTTLKQIMEEYGVGGRVAWVYRQFPIQQLHPNSPIISEAALCVGDIAGNEAFWKFSDMVFERREIDEPTNILLLPDFAEESGVNRGEYQACMDSGRMKDTLRASMEDAFNIGARGTPYTVIMVGNQQAVLNGAQTYESIKVIIDGLIAQLGAPVTTPAAENNPPSATSN